MSGLLRLITGKKGAAKTLWVVDHLFKEFEKDPERNYFSDITALKHTGVQPAPDDWREIPDNSLIVYDEVQFKLLFSRHNSKRDMQILDLTEMRKRGIEMWIITQRARFLNADVLGLVDEHIEIQRNGKRTSKVYVFQDAETNITKTKKLFASDKYVYAHPQELWGFYESIKDGAKHGNRSFLNKGAITTGITLFIAAVFAITFIYKSLHHGGMKVSSGTEKQHVQDVPKVNPQVQQQVSSSTTNVNPSDLSAMCRQAVNLQKPECVKWFDDLTKNKSSVNQDGTVVQSVSYHPEDPYNDLDIKKNMQYQIVNQPKFSGCMKINGQYRAYTEQGTYLNASKSVCDRLMRDSGSRPYDYFTAHNTQSNSVPSVPVTNSGERVLPNMNNNPSPDQSVSGVYNIPNNPTFKETDITKPSV